MGRGPVVPGDQTAGRGLPLAVEGDLDVAHADVVAAIGVQQRADQLVQRGRGRRAFRPAAASRSRPRSMLSAGRSTRPSV